MMRRVWHSPGVLRVGSQLLCLLSLAVLVAAAAIWVAGHPRLHIREVEVRPLPESAQAMAAWQLDLIRDEDLRTALEPIQNETLLTAALPDLRDRLERLNWVRRAAVRRVWPDRLLVLIEPQTPAAVWRGNLLLNSQGETFDPAPWSISALHERMGCRLPQLRGPEETAALVLAEARAWKPRLKDADLISLELTTTRSWRMDLALPQQSAPLAVELGRAGLRPDADQRVAQSLATHAWLSAQMASQGKRVVGLDLRYARGYAVRTQPLSDPPKTFNAKTPCLETPTI